jgi:cobalt-precorrin-7 (C5)-methyltransferase
MKIVGVGCGPGLLTEEAIYAISRAELIYGSDRAIAIAHAYIPPDCQVKTIDDFKALGMLPEEAVVLSTGDPMLAGLGYLNGEVIPGISSLQIAAARLRIPLSRIVPVVAHGKGHERGMQAVIEEISRNRVVFLLADPTFDVPELYRRIQALRTGLSVAVCENLGYPDERIIAGTMDDNPPFPSGELYSLMIGDF